MALAVPTLLVLGAGASDAQQPGRQARMAEHTEQAVSRLTQELSLTAAQVDFFEKSLASGRQPGALWSLAAELEPTLTDAQKALLFTRPERPQRDGRPGRAERHAAEQQARDTVLGLSDEQSRQMDDLHERHEAERERAHEQMRRNLSGRPESAEITAMLTPGQQEIFKVHHALRGRMHGSPMRGGRGPHGFGDGGPTRDR